MNGVDLRALLKRLEELEGPDHDVDAFLFREVFPEAFKIFSITPWITSSLDHALKLAKHEFPNDVVDFLRAAIWAESKRHHRHVTYHPLDVPELARGVLIEVVKKKIAKAEAEEGVGEF